MASLPNVYTHRKVAEGSSKPCEICYKLSSSVLMTPEQQDWFYVCPGHLKDRTFCTPIIDQAAIDAKKKQEMEAEVEKVKKEYEERQRKKKEESEKSKDKDKDTDKEKDKDGDNEKADDKKADESKDDKKAEEEPPAEEEPRVFALHRTFHQNRIEKRRAAEMAKRDAEIAKLNQARMQNPDFFPAVPRGDP